MRPAVSLGILLIAGTVCHSADRIVYTPCAPQKPPDAREWWSFREIDGKRCWYVGKPGKPKFELFWPASSRKSPAEPEEQEPIEGPPQVPSDGPAPPIKIIPVVPTTESSFEDRWSPVLGCGYHFVGTWDCRPARHE
jgi:hypothetical protein